MRRILDLALIALLNILANVYLSESARILGLFTFSAPSHHFVYRGVLEELARRGHEVVYMTSVPYEKPPKGIQQIDLGIQAYEEEMDEFSFGEQSIPQIVRMMFRLGTDMAPLFLGNAAIQELIRSDQKFDAVMFESYFFQEYHSALIHKFNAVGIEIMPSGNDAWLNEMSGLPDNPSYQLDYKSEQTNSMNFWQRLYNTYVTATTTLVSYYYLRTGLQAAMDRYLQYPGWETRPPLEVLARNRSLILVNADQALTYPFPTAPHVKLIGGINIRPNSPLPQDLLKFMDESKSGVIYMSFGSYINFNGASNRHILDSFLSAFKKLPHRVLMKFDNQNNERPPSNVKFVKWLPQQDILAHKNCVLFITHGGFLSLTEAVYHGVPLVGIPAFADQANNLLFAESRGFGRLLRFRNISEKSVSWAIKEVLNNHGYKEEILRRSKVLRDKRHSPAEEAAYWVEHSLRYPYALTPKSVELSPIQLHMIDVKVFILTVFISLIYAFYTMTRLIIKCVSSKSKNKVKLQ